MRETRELSQLSETYKFYLLHAKAVLQSLRYNQISGWGSMLVRGGEAEILRRRQISRNVGGALMMMMMMR